MKTNSKKIILLLAFSAALIALAAWLAPKNPDGAPYLRLFQTNHFTLKGDMAFPDGEDRVLVTGIVERHAGADYSILYPRARSYAIVDGQYYRGVRGDCLVPIDAPAPEEEEMYLEMIYRNSAFGVCQGDFSRMTFLSRTETELLTPSGTETISCTCEEYLVEDSDSSIRMYFVDHELYAIQAMAYPDTTFYVTDLSSQCQRVL